MEKNEINEKEESDNYIDIYKLGLAHKYQYLENKIFKVVYEDKEEESEFYSSNKKIKNFFK